jgi:glycosyltransferase involved in cell wall biosynthesis
VKAGLLIPIFNHRETIGAVVADLASLDRPCLIVDDGSDADTRETLRCLAHRFPWVEVSHLPENRGRGAALRHGYRVACERGWSHVVQIDADGQHDPAAIPAFLAAAERAPSAAIIGEPRFDHTAPLVRVYGRRLSQLIVWGYTLSREIHDPLCGFRCFPLAPVIRLLESRHLGDRMEFDVELLVYLAWAGVPFVNVETHVRYFPGGISHFRMVRDNVLIAKAYAKLFPRFLLRLRP